jgi:ABC-type dipeptide/oligopeptide/nickel transport system ATPase component
MGVIAEIADTVGVMYRGHLVEFGTRDQVFGNPLHPYTRDLIAAIPKYDGTLPQASARRDYGKLERTLLHD